MQEFNQAIKNNQTESLSLQKLEGIADEFPYFQFAKTLLLKKYHQQKHYKYNNSLKNVAAHTINREVLFDYITHIHHTTTTVSTKPIVEKTPLTNLKEKIIPQIITEETPFEFTHSEKHSFHQWLQLSNTTPIVREEPKKIEETVNPKLNIINQFIQNNPKISPVKKTIQTPTTALTPPNSDISNELMTETLAKVYLAQKKYDNAIQAYKILSLKYPEKSGLFADQIQRIKNLQNT
ncbi:hypothetical protein FHR24_000114 [Wenyingzhuangia heitensis]|uniref:Tetratricopeptide repeat-containing protein n=1 Tax=Wenyingzhuangia heitensis TaxID=1487859 RepID=A0ABX0U7G1_9FLAO|nr:hypothetical protein [Wenyingzhuangia heitensis]NIJ43675.1 hypothetical protein [Wenyingzhuangia heitensis]